MQSIDIVFKDANPSGERFRAKFPSWSFNWRRAGQLPGLLRRTETRYVGFQHQFSDRYRENGGELTTFSRGTFSLVKTMRRTLTHLALFCLQIRQRMQAQITSLNENFEQAQLRIRSLQSHVNYLKSSYTNIFAPEIAPPVGPKPIDGLTT